MRMRSDSLSISEVSRDFGSSSPGSTNSKTARRTKPESKNRKWNRVTLRPRIVISSDSAIGRITDRKAPAVRYGRALPSTPDSRE